MRIVFTLSFVLATISADAADTALYLFGGQGHKEFLGCLNCGSTHPKSVWNELSQFGFKNAFGVWNPFREFINPFSSQSMCNAFASDPPIIVDENGNAYGRMSINEFAPGSVCGVAGSERLCRTVRSICQSTN
jgi:hypothetical protein